MHGPQRIYRGSSWSAIFWALMMLVAFVLLVVQIVQLCQLYTGKPIVSSVPSRHPSKEFQVSFIIPQEGLNFPAVTICNLNPVKKTFVEATMHSGFTRQLLDYLLLSNVEVQTLWAHGNPLVLERGETTLQ